MNTVSIIFWSGTGNTEAMAHAVLEGAKEAGADVQLWNVEEANVEELQGTMAIALGCPSMGAEQLEDSSMEPFMSELDGKIAGKTVALFGSYGWGGGEWMQDWEERIVSDGASVLNEKGIIVNGEPSEEELETCRQYGRDLAKVEG